MEVYGGVWLFTGTSKWRKAAPRLRPPSTLHKSRKHQSLAVWSCSTESKDQTPCSYSEGRGNVSVSLWAPHKPDAASCHSDQSLRLFHPSELQLSTASGFSDPLNSHWGGSRSSCSTLQGEPLPIFSNMLTPVRWLGTSPLGSKSYEHRSIVDTESSEMITSYSTLFKLFSYNPGQIKYHHLINGILIKIKID